MSAARRIRSPERAYLPDIKRPDTRAGRIYKPDLRRGQKRRGAEPQGYHGLPGRGQPCGFMRLSGILSPLPLISAKETNTHMKRTAQAHWQGDLKSGKGSLTSPSQVLNNTAYSFHTRFENEHGTNPEELLAAAHAGCFTMALSAQLANAGLTADSLDHREPSRPAGENSRRHEGSLRYSRQGGRNGLSGFETLQDRHHRQCGSRKLITPYRSERRLPDP